MYPPLHPGDGHAVYISDHQLSGVPNRGRLREVRNLRIRNFCRIGKLIGEGTQPRPQHQRNLWPQLGARENKLCRSLSALIFIGTSMAAAEATEQISLPPRFT